MIKLVKRISMSLGLAVFFPAILFADSTEHHYSNLQQFLSQYLKDGLVNYQEIQKSPGSLDQILSALEAVQKEDYKNWKLDQQKAFWINAYNVAVIRTVIDHYPLKKTLSWKALAYPSNSIQQIPNVWERKVIKLLGKERSLNEIEHEILRKEFKDPRIHFALVCASLGCPRLRSEPYAGGKLDFQLDDQAKRFLADPSKAHYDSGTKTLHLSPIFKWFKKDFGKELGVLLFVKKYLPREAGWRITAKTQLAWLDYDWSLNGKN